MQRRDFFRMGIGIAGLIGLGRPAQARAERRLVLQQSPLAGFQYYEGAALWPSLYESQALRLVREADNIHDPRAVKVYAGNAPLGYIPRRDNAAVASLLDRGHSLRASIVALNGQSDDPWGRVVLGVEV